MRHYYHLFKYPACAVIAMIASVFFTLPAAEASGIQAASHLHDPNGGSLSSLIMDVLIYGLRAVYYFLLLTTAGAMLLFMAVPQDEQRQRQRTLMKSWTGVAMKAMLLVVLLHVFVQSNRIAKGLDGGFADWLRVFTETSSGQAWLALVLLAMIGPAALRLPDAMKACWALLALSAESFVGHAAAADKLTLTVVSDFVHLACSSVWASGVALLLLFWKTDRKEAGRFSETFSQIAWLTIVLLAVTGSILTWSLLEDWVYVWYTDWGRWLIAKTVLVLAVIAIGALLRGSARRREMPRGILLKLDGAAMAAILIIVGIFTAVSPALHGDPVNYHRMGGDMHYTLRVEPNTVGPNDVSLQIWLPESSGSPRSVVLQLIRGDDGKRVIEVPLEERPTDAAIAFPGYQEFRYTANELVLEGIGSSWTARTVVQLAGGEEIVREMTFESGY
ncbi:CopD family protein [Paenibacillus sp. LHD-117]|uniref:copper resistance D family protein n=1 Tax=Paenibacillus sp. LHD-117 TaxID=3071412 RepID=UPI0027DEE06A|nr:CopD family protein [Paenibacillus sp. LHD-117]MDQ6423018.1 CopD family protein [Paenibacillus sp. LHD-117]